MKEVSLDRTKAIELTSVLGLLGVAMFLPFIIHLQWITGPIINAILILILFLGGLRLGLLVSFIPSLMALSGGLLPFVLAPVVPFIVLSNILYVTAINYFYHIIKKEQMAFIISIIIASSLKFLFLLSTTSIMTKLVLKQNLVAKIALMMSWPQLFTALSGGLIAFLILKWLKRI
jgi:hypothetical protein